MPEGFVLTRQWLEQPDGQDLVFWLATDQRAGQGRYRKS